MHARAQARYHRAMKVTRKDIVFIAAFSAIGSVLITVAEAVWMAWREFSRDPAVVRIERSPPKQQQPQEKRP